MFRAARTKTEFFRVSVLLRTSRAKVGVEKTATAITTLAMPLPRIATMAIARISPGKANNNRINPSAVISGQKSENGTTDCTDRNSAESDRK